MGDGGDELVWIVYFLAPGVCRRWIHAPANEGFRSQPLCMDMRDYWD